MRTALKPYPEYRDSGVDWLAKVPTHWEFVRNGRLFAERNETGFPDLPILEVSLRTGVRVRDMEGGRKQQMADRSKYKRAAQGDIAYNIMRMWQGAVGIAPCDGLISPAYVVARPIGDIEPRFYTYLFRTSAYMREVDFASRGIVPDRNRLYWQYFKPLLSPAPPSEEQRQIADFLDAYNAQVHRLIAAKRRTIAVLIERKQAIIEGLLGAGVGQASQSVFHPDVGQMPGHWRVARLKDWCKVNARTLPENTPKDYTFDYFDISVVGTGVLTGEPQSMAFEAAPSRARRRLAPNDILISTVRTYLKAIYFFQSWPRDAIASTGFAVLSPRSGVLPELMAYALMTPRFIDVVISRSVGVAYPAIAETRLSALHLALPTDESEQQLILDAIKADTQLVDEAIARERGQVDLILEYRDSLIAAVVTGRLDVRDAAIPVVEGDDFAADEATYDEYMEDALDAAD